MHISQVYKERNILTGPSGPLSEVSMELAIGLGVLVFLAVGTAAIALCKAAGRELPDEDPYKYEYERQDSYL